MFCHTTSAILDSTVRLMASHPSKRRRLTPPRSEDDRGSGVSDTKVQKQFFRSASNWNLEEDYANRPKKGKKKKEKKEAADVGRLPIRSAGGTWVAKDEDVESIASDADWLESDGDEEVVEEEPVKPVVEEPKIPESEQLRQAQEELAKIATQLNEDPEEHPGAFKALAKIGESRVVSVQKLALVTQMAVYRDVIPGYRIRPATEDVSKEKLSKDVKRLRTYEEALVTGYGKYVQTLAKYASSGRDKKTKILASIAITCACTLLNAVPHFNFRSELIRILVKKLSGREVDADFTKCREAMETLFREDEEGKASFEAASMVSKMMKAKEYRVNEAVLNLFLHLRLLSEFAGKGSRDNVTQAGDDSHRKQKQKKEFRTKKERKMLKEQKAAEKVMAHADAAVSHEEREKMQSETLKVVFAAYFRILKMRSPNLMGAVLEGLARYAHLINQDFFGDLLEALKDLIRYSEQDANAEDEDAENEVEDEDDNEVGVVRDTSREALLCTVTAFALLEGQDAHNARSDLHLDLSFFTTHLFQSLLTLSMNPDLELGAKSLQLTDTDGNRRNNRINIQTTTVLLIKCLSGILLPPWNIRSVPPLRLAAFTKQLMSGSLQVPEKSCQALLALLGDVLHTHGKKINALWNTEERKGDGVFKPMAAIVEGSNPFASTVWEGELLRKHYCPKVRESQKAIEKSLRTL